MSRTQAMSSLLQSLPMFRGKRRLGRTLMNVTGVSRRREFVISTKAGRFFLPNLKDMISIDLFLNGFYEWGLVKLLTESIPQGGSFIDVGANIGSISIAVARLRPDIRVISVEASPWIFSVLQKNVALNRLQNVTPINYAVYSESGKTLPMFAPKDLFGKGSLKAVYTQDAEMVETITIDHIAHKFALIPVHYIKVDVEGFEAAVFRGMSDILAVEKPKIVFEFSEWAEVAAGFFAGEAQSVLLDKGFSLQMLDDTFQLASPVTATSFKVKNANLFAS